VRVDGKVVGQCGQGLLVMVAVAPNDDDETALWLARKLAGLRIFNDEEGRMNHSVVDVEGNALVISQFTLYGNCRKGRRPSFVRSAQPDIAEPLYRRFCELLEAAGVPAQQGIFGADMKVSLVNDGPVTLLVDSP